MAGLMIIAHAPLATALKAVAEHTYPECARQLEALDVEPAADREVVEQAARSMLARVRDPEAIVFTDVAGATPGNVAHELADGQQVRVVAGVNVPMIWRSLCYRHEPLQRVIDLATAGAIAGVKVDASNRPQNQNMRTGSCSDDQAKHHHQQ